jgi:type II secretory pathway component GspD/PulD (secretin)
VVNETAASFQAATARVPSSRLRLGVSILLLVAVVAGAALWKLVPHGPAALQHVRMSGQPKITITARNEDVSKVLQDVASQSGAILAIDPTLVGKFSIETRGAKLEDLMNDLCTAFSCKWELSGGPQRALVVRRAESAPPISPSPPKVL